MKCQWLLPILIAAATVAILPALLPRAARAQERSQSPGIWNREAPAPADLRTARLDALTSLSHTLGVALLNANTKTSGLERAVDDAHGQIERWGFEAGAADDALFSRYDLNRVLDLADDMRPTVDPALLAAQGRLMIAGANWAVADYQSDLSAFISKHAARAKEIESIASSIPRASDRSEFLTRFYGYLQYDHCRISLKSSECATATAVANGSRLGDGVDVRR